MIISGIEKIKTVISFIKVYFQLVHSLNAQAFGSSLDFLCLTSTGDTVSSGVKKVSELLKYSIKANIHGWASTVNKSSRKLKLLKS